MACAKDPPESETPWWAGGLHRQDTPEWRSLSIPRTIRPFRPDEDAIIRSWPPERSLRELAQTLGREYGTVKVRYWRLRGLKTLPQRRSSRRWRPTDQDRCRIRNLLKLLVITQHLRAEHRLRGQLATDPDWVSRLVEAASRHARRQRRLDQTSWLEDPDFLDEYFQGGS